ncbi:MAG: hypothetical protein HYY43_04720 [Deltaproteobacteria bacterium]|nr:hypothetical protein [Deltaproteobacteria bacterium]MBI2974874.1 hypothetical protein [Deltaproteobacteria bacterium]
MKIKGFVDVNLCPRIPFFSVKSEKLSLVVDTGFNGALCLPKHLLRDIGFEPIGTYEIELADGSCVPSAVYLGEILWFRRRTPVIAHETLSVEGLVGTELLRGSYFELDIEKNFVLITKK